MKKIFFLFSICLVAIYACSDNNDDIGKNILPESDRIAAVVKTFDVGTDTKTFDDGVYANATMFLIGKHDNASYGIVTDASLLASITYPRQNLTFPEGAVADSFILRLAISSRINNEPLKLNVYEMNNRLHFGTKYRTSIINNNNIDDYVDLAQVLGTKTFSAADYIHIDTTLKNGSVLPFLYVNLKKELAQKLIEKFSIIL